MNSIYGNRRIIVYGHNRSSQAGLLANILLERRIPHEWRDVVNGDPHYKDELLKLAHGHLLVPTVVFPDGTVMVEAWPDDALAKLYAIPGAGRSR